MKKIFLLFAVIASFVISCKKDKIGDNAIAAVDPRDKFVGEWVGKYKFNIPNLPTNPGLPSLPESVPTTLKITKSTTNQSEILIAISKNLTGNISAKATVNGNRYFYDPFNSKFFNLVDVSLKGDGLLETDGTIITEEGNLNSKAFSFTDPLGVFPTINIPDLEGTWTSRLNKKP